MKRTLVIGDIHGCYEEMLALIDLAQLGPSDQIISIGDLFDRGPNSPAVYRYFRDRANNFAILGNHERKHIRAAAGELTLARSQKLTRRQFAESDEDYEEAVAWMESLPLYLELPEALIVHGFLEPGVALADQHPSVLCGTLGGKGYLKRTGRWPWYEQIHLEKPVLVGHENYTDSSQPFIYQQKVYGLDTGCVHGKTLTGILLPEFRILQILAGADYWATLAKTLR